MSWTLWFQLVLGIPVAIVLGLFAVLFCLAIIKRMAGE